MTLARRLRAGSRLRDPSHSRGAEGTRPVADTHSRVWNCARQHFADGDHENAEEARTPMFVFGRNLTDGFMPRDEGRLSFHGEDRIH